MRRILKQLLSGHRQVQKAAFERWMQETFEEVSRYVMSRIANQEDAEDVVQEIYFKAWKGLHTLHHESHLQAWLMRIARNEVVNYYKRKRSTLPLALAVEEEPSENFLDYIQYLEPCLVQLPPMQRRVFVMRQLEGKSYRRIAQELQLSIGALKATYHHAIKKLKKLLKNELRNH